MSSKYYKCLLVLLLGITLMVESSVASAYRYYDRGYRGGYNRAVVYNHGGYYYGGARYNYYNGGRYYNNCAVVPGHWSYGVWIHAHTRCW